MVYYFVPSDFSTFDELRIAIEEASENYTPTEKRPLALYVSYRSPTDEEYQKTYIEAFKPDLILPLFQMLQNPSQAWDHVKEVGSDVVSRFANSVAKRDMETNALVIDKLLYADQMVLFQFGEDLSSVEEPLRGVLKAYNPPPIYDYSRAQHGFFKFELTEEGKETLKTLERYVDKPKEEFKHKPRGFVGAVWLAANLRKACYLFQLPFEEMSGANIGYLFDMFDESHENLPEWFWNEKRQQSWAGLAEYRRVRSVPCHAWSLQMALKHANHPQIEQIMGVYTLGELGGVATVSTAKFVEFLAGFGCRIKKYKLSESDSGPKVTFNLSKKVCDTEVLLEFDQFHDHLMWHYTPTEEDDGWLFEKGLLKKFNVLQGLRFLLDNKYIRPLNGYEVYKRLDFAGGFDQQCDFEFKHFMKQAAPECVPEHQRIASSKRRDPHPPIIGFFDFEASTDEDHHRPYCISYCVVDDIEKFKDSSFSIKNIWGKDLDCASKFLKEIGDFWHKYGAPLRKKAFVHDMPNLVLYAHNLAYDCTFIKPFLTDRRVTEQGGRVYQVEGTYTYWVGHKPTRLRLILQDTLCLFQSSLRNVGRDYIWGDEAKAIKKEVFPYDWYTFANFNRHPSGWAPVSEIQESLHDTAKFDEFMVNLRGFGPSMYDDVSNCFNYQKYAAFYCDQDVRVLARAFYNLRLLYLGKQLESTTIHGTVPFSVDILDRITASGIAYTWFLDTVVDGNNKPIKDRCIPQEEEQEEIRRAVRQAHPKMRNEEKIEKLVREEVWKRFYERLSQYENDLIFECNGPLRYTILAANRGGRCMTRDNEKWYYNAAKHNGVKLQDYDAVSLYPSAMRRLWLSTGKMKLFRSKTMLTQEDFKQRWLRSEQLENPEGKWTDAVIHVTSLHSVRKSHFPVLCLRDPATKLNDWRNFEHETVDTWINAIDLENFIDFQQGEFEWDQAIFWDQKRNTLIQGQIQALFDFRKANKEKESYHPIEKVAKTMMNSISGKSITKIHKSETKYLNYNRFDSKYYYPKWITENAYRVKSLEICAGNEIKAKVYSRDFGYALPIFGQDVFAMARKIIQPVFNIGEDLELEHPEMAPSIFYTDTDSLHIREDMLKLVEERYIQLYHKSLKGKELGEFHIDFDPVAGHQVLGAIESYFCTKKIYVDRLLLDNGELAYHKRMKGIPNDLLTWEHYVKIFNGEIVPFQLVDPNHPSFIFEEGVIKSRRAMERKIMLKEARENLIKEAALLKDLAKTLKRAAKETDDEDTAKRQKI